MKWNKKGTQPAAPGVYATHEVDHINGSPTFQYWDGALWGYCSCAPSYCRSPSEHRPSSLQTPDWRSPG